MSILYMLEYNIGENTTEYLCKVLEIDRVLLYTYITEINNFFADFQVISGRAIPWEVEYDRYLKKYVLQNNNVSEEQEKI